MATLAELMTDPSQRARLPAGMRNNNPGNIKFTSRAAFPGVVGPSVNTDQGDPQAVFASPEAGMAAMFQLAARKYNGGKRSANQLIAGNMGWTPGNFQAAANVARYAGLDPNADLNLNDPAAAGRFLRGLMTQEHGPASKLYTDAMINAAVTGLSGAKPSMFAPTAADARAMSPGMRAAVKFGRDGTDLTAPQAPVPPSITPSSPVVAVMETPSSWSDGIAEFGRSIASSGQPQAVQPLAIDDRPAPDTSVAPRALAANLTSNWGDPLGALGDKLAQQRQRIAAVGAQGQQPQQPVLNGLSQLFA